MCSEQWDDRPVHEIVIFRRNRSPKDCKFSDYYDAEETAAEWLDFEDCTHVVYRNRKTNQVITFTKENLHQYGW
jgi:predicted nucleic acid-binding protein